MKLRLACLTLVLAFSCSAHADDMADAAKAFEAKSYAVALQLYSKQAAAGNPVAQFRLGEMYWYGEGVAPDLVKADELFRKSAAAGNAEAKAALNVMKQREVRRADIDYWTGKYDGAELKAAAAACKAPVIPEVSKKNDEIKEVSADMVRWQKCYNDFVDRMNDALPAGKRIPADVADLMNEHEYTQSKAHLDQLYAKISTHESASAAATLDAYQKWVGATERYAAEHNKVVDMQRQAEKLDIEAMQRQQQNLGHDTKPRYPTTTR